MSKIKEKKGRMEKKIGGKEESMEELRLLYS